MENLGLESFAYSKGESKLFKDLCDLFTKERAIGFLSKKQLNNSTLAKLIMDHLGINIVDIELIDEVDLYGIRIPIISSKDINIMRRDADKYIGDVLEKNVLFSIDNVDRANIWTGSIDLKKHKVSGIFSKLPTTLYISSTDVYEDKSLPIEEIAASVLHELGHAMYGFYMLTQVVTFNIVMQTINEELNNSSEDKYKIVLKDLATKVNVSKEEHERLSRSRTNKEGYDILIHSVVEKIRSSTKSIDVDRTFNESYADMFVIRNGAGKYLFDSLNRHYEIKGRGYDSKTKASIISCASHLILALGIGFVACPILAVLPWTGSVMFLFINLAIIGDDHDSQNWYEDPLERLTRIKMDTLGELKQKGISSERRTQLNEQLVNMNKVLTVIHDDKSQYIEFIKSIRPGYRLYKEDLKQQRNLQQLGRHDLILASSMLKENV